MAPRSTFHHVFFLGALGPIPIESVLIQVAAFLSIALLASYKWYDVEEGNIGDWEASAWKDRSSVKSIFKKNVITSPYKRCINHLLK